MSFPATTEYVAVEKRRLVVIKGELRSNRAKAEKKVVVENNCLVVKSLLRFLNISIAKK